MCYWFKRPSILSFIKIFDYHLFGCKPFKTATQIGMEWHFDDTMDVNLYREKKNNKLEETMLGPKPNSVSTNGSVQEKNNKNPTLEWLEHLYKIPPKRSKNVTSDLFISACSIFLRRLAVQAGFHPPSLPNAWRRFQRFQRYGNPPLRPWHPCHAKREKLREKHTHPNSHLWNWCLDCLTWFYWVNELANHLSIRSTLCWRKLP